MKNVPSSSIGNLGHPLVFLDEVDGVLIGSVCIMQLLFDLVYDVASVDADIGVYCEYEWMLIWVLVRS